MVEGSPDDVVEEHQERSAAAAGAAGQEAGRVRGGASVGAGRGAARRLTGPGGPARARYRRPLAQHLHQRRHEADRETRGERAPPVEERPDLALHPGGDHHQHAGRPRRR